jgi:UDP-N-acetylmuramoylalanine--D-glutamate ligase
MLDVRNQRVTVAGLGKFGGNLAAARWLVEQGAKVLVTDQSPAEKLTKSVEQLEDLPITWRLGEHREEDFTQADLVVASPAIPPANRFLQAARAAGVPVTTEIMLFIERCPATIVGVTGTKGKSTTTALLGAMLKRRFTTHVGGNIGKSLLPELPRIGKSDVVVLELSSFMLHYLRAMKWSPHVAVVTMIAADHLDWHGSREAYVADKWAIVEFQRPDDFAVLNESDATSRELAKGTKGNVVWFGTEGREPFEMMLPGAHNQFNAQAAFTAASLLGVTRDEAADATREFRGLDHRLNLVHEANGVRYYDDSIATIPEAAVAALVAFPPRTVIQIVGGHDKKLDLTVMCNALADRAKAVLCIGFTGTAIAEKLQAVRGTGVYQCGDLATAMKEAKAIAAPGDVVLLSTGCASYDQFANFEERGNTFARLARES